MATTRRPRPNHDGRSLIEVFTSAPDDGWASFRAPLYHSTRTLRYGGGWLALDLTMAASIVPQAGLESMRTAGPWETRAPDAPEPTVAPLRRGRREVVL